MERYEPHEIERRWQAVWADERTWEAPNPGEPGFDGAKPKFYVLEMLPYPSGEPHVGHLKTYSVGDAIAHVRRPARQLGVPGPVNPDQPRHSFLLASPPDLRVRIYAASSAPP